jgi:excisionase family DNA binding protein
MKRATRQDNPAKRDTEASVGTETRLLTVKEAAERTQVSVRKLRGMIKSGEVRVKRFGKAVRIHPKDIGL